MLRFLLNRPIAVCATLTVALALSVLAWLNLPVSLMPPLAIAQACCCALGVLSTEIKWSVVVGWEVVLVNRYVVAC